MGTPLDVTWSGMSPVMSLTAEQHVQVDTKCVVLKAKYIFNFGLCVLKTVLSSGKQETHLDECV